MELEVHEVMVKEMEELEEMVGRHGDSEGEKSRAEEGQEDRRYSLPKNG